MWAREKTIFTKSVFTKKLFKKDDVMQKSIEGKKVVVMSRKKLMAILKMFKLKIPFLFPQEFVLFLNSNASSLEVNFIFKKSIFSNLRISGSTKAPCFKLFQTCRKQLAYNA